MRLRKVKHAQEVVSSLSKLSRAWHLGQRGGHMACGAGGISPASCPQWPEAVLRFGLVRDTGQEVAGLPSGSARAGDSEEQEEQQLEPRGSV